MDVNDIIQESNNNRPTLQSELERVTAASIELSSSGVNVNPKETCTEIVTGIFTMNSYEENAKIRYFGNMYTIIEGRNQIQIN